MGVEPCLFIVCPIHVPNDISSCADAAPSLACARPHVGLGSFQDTNTLYFSNFLATIGVADAQGIAYNIVASPRKAKEAVGAFCKLTHDDGRTMVCSVEYNQVRSQSPSPECMRPYSISLLSPLAFTPIP